MLCVRFRLLLVETYPEKLTQRIERHARSSLGRIFEGSTFLTVTLLLPILLLLQCFLYGVVPVTYAVR